jgi:hypothetical protein
MIPVGATLERVYWSAPGPYTIGPEYTTQAGALEAAINEKREAVAAHLAHYRKTFGNNFVPLPERITVVRRWVFQYIGGKTDAEIERFEYASIADAEAGLERLRRFGGE